MPLSLGFGSFADLIRSRRIRVAGHSMEPTLIENDLLLVSRRFPDRGRPARGDIVLFRDPLMGVDDIKRVCGLPGELVEQVDGALIIDGSTLNEPYTIARASGESNRGSWSLSEDEYIVLGDNRDDSRDSRAFGPVHRSFIVGRAWCRYGPAGRSGRLAR